MIRHSCRIASSGLQLWRDPIRPTSCRSAAATELRRVANCESDSAVAGGASRGVIGEIHTREPMAEAKHFAGTAAAQSLFDLEVRGLFQRRRVDPFQQRFELLF